MYSIIAVNVGCLNLVAHLMCIHTYVRIYIAMYVRTCVAAYTYIGICFLKGIKIIEGPSDVITKTTAVFFCNVTDPALPSWIINGRVYLRNEPYPAGHVLGDFNLTVTSGINGSNYICVITFANGSAIFSDPPAFLYYAGKLMFMYLHSNL